MSYIILDAGAYQMAINVLERAGKYEVVEEIKKNAVRVKDYPSTLEWIEDNTEGKPHVKEMLSKYVGLVNGEAL